MDCYTVRHRNPRSGIFWQFWSKYGMLILRKMHYYFLWQLRTTIARGDLFASIFFCLKCRIRATTMKLYILRLYIIEYPTKRICGFVASEFQYTCQINESQYISVWYLSNKSQKKNRIKLRMTLYFFNSYLIPHWNAEIVWTYWLFHNINHATVWVI